MKKAYRSMVVRKSFDQVSKGIPCLLAADDKSAVKLGFNVKLHSDGSKSEVSSMPPQPKAHHGPGCICEIWCNLQQGEACPAREYSRLSNQSFKMIGFADAPCQCSQGKTRSHTYTHLYIWKNNKMTDKL